MNDNKQAFLNENSLAVIGISRTRGFGNAVFGELKNKGYRGFPISTTVDLVDGERCFRTLDELPEQVGGVVTVVPPAETEKIVADCTRLGILRIWMQRGSESPAAIRLAEENGLAVVHHACILMYAQPTSLHRVHAWLAKLFGKY